MLTFPTNKDLFFSYLSNILFLTQNGKNYAMFLICTKNEIICEAGLVNMLILADETRNFTDFSSITSL